MFYGKRKTWFGRKRMYQLKRYGAGLAGGTLGYIGGNIPGALAGAEWGYNNVPKYKKLKKSKPSPRGNGPIDDFDVHWASSNPSGSGLVAGRSKSRAKPLSAPRYKYARKRRMFF